MIPLLAVIAVAGGWWYLRAHRVAGPVQSTQGPPYDQPRMAGVETPEMGTARIPVTPYYSIAPGPTTSQQTPVDWGFIPKHVVSVPATLAGEQASWPLGLSPSRNIRTTSLGGINYQTLPPFVNRLP